MLCFELHNHQEQCPSTLCSPRMKLRCTESYLFHHIVCRSLLLGPSSKGSKAAGDGSSEGEEDEKHKGGVKGKGKGSGDRPRAGNVKAWGAADEEESSEEEEESSKGKKGGKAVGSRKKGKDGLEMEVGACECGLCC